MKSMSILPAALLMVFLAGCGPTIEMPDGFVEVGDDQRGSYDVRGVSADGVVVAVRTQGNEQNGSLAFWAKSIENEMAGRGYKLDAAEDIISAAGVAGRKFTFTADRAGMAYTYLLGLYVRDRDIVIAEAGGKADAVAPLTEGINKAIRSVR